MTEWAVIAARLLQFGAASVLFGSPLFYVYGLKDGAAGRTLRFFVWPIITLVLAAVLALLGAIWWVLAQTASIFSDPGTFGAGAVWTVLTGTRFGRAAFWRIGLIVVSLATLLLLPSGKRAWITQAVLGSGIVASFAWTGHGATDEGAAGVVHLIGDLLHLFAAAMWIGALAVLSILLVCSIRDAAETDARLTYDGLERFSGIGPAVVAVLVLSGITNSLFLVGSAHLIGLFTTPYGWLLDAKVGVFARMLALAAANRFALSPQLGSTLLNGEARHASLLALKRSILLETVLAVLVLAAVSWMGTLEPPRSAG